jgi:hypothetical protein
MITKMILVRSIINTRISPNEWLGSLYTLVLSIENNIENEPDTSIESCKSLLESISKNILTRLNGEIHTTESMKNKPVDTLLELAKNLLAEKVSNGEYTLISKLTKAVTIINDIRNKRGEISHGKILPKEIKSSTYLARTVVTFTDAFAYYILHLFLSIDLSYKEELKYEDNQNFNDSLDKYFNDSLDGLNSIVQISYSKALFDQDPVSYAEQLSDYQNDIDPE